MRTSVSSPAHVHHRSHSRPHTHRRAADPCAGQGGPAGPKLARRAARECAVTGPPSACAGSASEGLIRVYDQFGRKVEIGREAWRRDVLLPNLPRVAATPTHSTISSSARSTTTSRRTCSRPRGIPGRTRSASRSAARCCWASCCCSSRITPAPARCSSARSRGTARMPIYWRIWRAPSPRLATTNARRRSSGARLQLEPNEETALNWMIVAGERAKAARTPCSTAYARAGGAARQLARAAVAGAVSRWSAAISPRRRASTKRRWAARSPVPADLLMQLSGDLGNRGHTELLVRLTQPRFDLARARTHRRQQPAARVTSSSACSPRRASCSSSSIRSSVPTGASTCIFWE